MSVLNFVSEAMDLARDPCLTASIKKETSVQAVTATVLALWMTCGLLPDEGIDSASNTRKDVGIRSPGSCPVRPVAATCNDQDCFQEAHSASRVCRLECVLKEDL